MACSYLEHTRHKLLQAVQHNDAEQGKSLAAVIKTFKKNTPEPYASQTIRTVFSSDIGLPAEFDGKSQTLEHYLREFKPNRDQLSAYIETYFAKATTHLASLAEPVIADLEERYLACTRGSIRRRILEDELLRVAGKYNRAQYSRLTQLTGRDPHQSTSDTHKARGDRPSPPSRREQ